MIELALIGHVMRRDDEHVLRKVLRTDVLGKRKRGRPKGRWMRSNETWRVLDRERARRRTGRCGVGRSAVTLESTGLRASEETDWEMWSRKICSHTGEYWTESERGDGLGDVE